MRVHCVFVLEQAQVPSLQYLWQLAPKGQGIMHVRIGGQKYPGQQA